MAVFSFSNTHFFFQTGWFWGHLLLVYLYEDVWSFWSSKGLSHTLTHTRSDAILHIHISLLSVSQTHTVRKSIRYTVQMCYVIIRIIILQNINIFILNIAVEKSHKWTSIKYIFLNLWSDMALGSIQWLSLRSGSNWQFIWNY